MKTLNLEKLVSTNSYYELPYIYFHSIPLVELLNAELHEKCQHCEENASHLDEQCHTHLPNGQRLVDTHFWVRYGHGGIQGIILQLQQDPRVLQPQRDVVQNLLQS